MSKEIVVPPSREVRVEDGVAVGVVEDLLFRAHSGNTEDLLRSMVATELIIADQRRQAVESYAASLACLLTLRGTIGSEDVRHSLSDWHESEILAITSSP